VTRDEWLRRLADAPADDWLAFADWLQQAGDPRGELIALDVALERATGDDEARPLQDARAPLVAAHGAALLGETMSRAVSEGYIAISWRRGFVESVRYSGQGLDHRRVVGWIVNILDGEPFRFVRRIELPWTDLEDVAWLDRFPHLAEVDVRGCRIAPEKLRVLGLRGVHVRR
jgi:uncharacterized protein (TIGR02996 family)